MAVLDDIRDGKGLKPITFNCFTCQNDNCIASGSKTETYQCPGYKHKKTNADRIRSMSDEDLADFYFRHSWGIADQWCTPSGERCRHEDLMKKMDEPQCKLCFLDWLKQECE